jgi:hypothetical protein
LLSQLQSPVHSRSKLQKTDQSSDTFTSILAFQPKQIGKADVRELNPEVQRILQFAEDLCVLNTETADPDQKQVLMQ